MTTIPSYLKGYDQIYEDDPRKAAREWFNDANYGLFLHYGLYSLLGDHEWVQYHERIDPAHYAQLQHHFTAENFDAERIVEFAQDCGMNYINITSKHHEGFCLFDSDYTTYTVTEAPAERDLVAELADACQEAGMGLFLYYSHGYDWHHPHAPNRDEWGDPARPAYDEQPGCYASTGHALERYLDYVESQVTELLSEYGPIAGIWFDPSYLPQQDRDRFAAAFNLESLYETIRECQPQTLISYKEGVTGTEDFITPEHETSETDALGEVSTTMIPSDQYRDELGDIWGYNDEDSKTQKNVATSWGYAQAAEGMHRGEDETWDILSQTLSEGYNLLLNTGLLPDGSLDPDDIEILRRSGQRIERDGYPP